MLTSFTSLWLVLQGSWHIAYDFINLFLPPTLLCLFIMKLDLKVFQLTDVLCACVCACMWV